MSELSSPPDDYRPLLRVQSASLPSAAAVEDFGYAGIIISPQHGTPISPEFLAEKRECWVDISHLTDPQLRGWHLEVDGDTVTTARNASDEIDWHHCEAAANVIAWLTRRGTEKLTGLICKPSLPEFSYRHPPFPWSPFLPPHFADSALQALVSSTGNEAAVWRQAYWDALHTLREEQFEKLQEWCDSQNVRLARSHFRPEWHAFNLDESLRTRVDLARARSRDKNTCLPSVLQGDTLAQKFESFIIAITSGATRFETESSSISFEPGAKQFNQSVDDATQKFSTTRNAARVGVLFPARSAQTHYHPDGHRFTRWIAEDLQTTIRLLDELHYDWLFVFEDDLFPRECSLEMIVVPGVSALGTDIWKALEDFVGRGGKVACLGLLPRWSQNGRDAAFQKYVGNAALVEVGELYEAYAALEAGDQLPPTIGFPVFREHPNGGRFCSYQPRLNEDVEDATLRVHQILRESLVPDFESQNKNARYVHRLTSDGDSMFLVWNRGDNPERINARLVPPQPAKQVFYTGVIERRERPLPVWMPHPEEQGGGLSLTLELAGGEACLINTSASNSSPYLERANFTVESFDGSVVMGYATANTSPRVAHRKDAKLEWYFGEDVVVPYPLLLSSDNWQLAAKEERREYFQKFAAPDDWHKCRIFLEIAGSTSAISVRLNGIECGLRFSSPWRFDVTSAIRVGAANSLTLQRSLTKPEEADILARLVAYPQVIINIEQ